MSEDSLDEKRKEAAYWQENIHLFESLLTNRWGHLLQVRPVSLKERFESLQKQLINSIRDDVVLYYNDCDKDDHTNLASEATLYDSLAAKYKFAAHSPRGFTGFFSTCFSTLSSYGIGCFTMSYISR